MLEGQNRQRYTGNTIGEYGLIAALLACACMGALGLLGSGIKDSWDGFTQSLNAKPKTAVAIAGGKLSQAAVKPEPTIQNQPPSLSQPNGLMNKLVPSDFSPKATEQIIQVAGANGATLALLKELETRIQAMQASGEITEEEANLLYDLANKGHYLADAEKMLEDAYATGKDTITFEGKTYSTERFAGKVIGFNQALSVEGRWDMNPSGVNPAMKPFAEAFADLKKSNLYANPAVQQQIFEITLQIVAVDDALSWATEQMVSQGYPPSEWGQHQEQLTKDILSGFQENTQGAPSTTLVLDSASATNNANSAKICTTGNGKDNGKKCSN